MLLCLLSVPTGAMAQEDEGATEEESTSTKEEGTRWLTERQPELSKDTHLRLDHDPFEGSKLELRSWGGNNTLPDFDGGESERVRALHTRMRTRLMWEPVMDRFALELEADFFSGRVIGSEDPSSTMPEEVITGTRDEQLAYGDSLGAILDPRAANVRYTSRIGRVQAGLQTSDWGLGLLANGGQRDDEQLFGQRFGGDRSMRLLFGTTPFARVEAPWADKLFVGVGGDVVWRDENASFVRGDRAYQGVASMFLRDDDRFGGVYIVGRHQEDFDGARLDVIGFDGAFKREWSGDAFEVGVGGEAATLRGSTTRALPTTARADEVRLRGLGAAFEAELLHRATEVGGKFLSGFASGDANTDDLTQYRFRFDPNYKVGLILFDSYIPAMTRAWYRDADDPGRTANAPPGIEQVVSEGGIENAYYINPQLTFGNPDELLTGVGVLKAWAHEPPAAPVATFENGGTPTGVRGAEDVSRDLGWEVDVAVQYKLGLPRSLALELKGEFGILFPGEAFANAQGESAPPESMARGRISLIW